MALLKLEYAAFKPLVGVLSVYYIAAPDGSYDLYCYPAWGDTNYTIISDAADIADFVANVQPTATAVSSESEAAAVDNNAAGGRRAVKIQPFSKAGRNYQIVGQRGVMDLNADTNIDIAFAEEREIQGASVYVQNVTDGDYMDFYAMAPVGPGGSLVSVLHWGNTIYAKDKIRELYQTQDAKTIPLGITLRLVYHSIGTTGAQPVVIIDLVTWQ